VVGNFFAAVGLRPPLRNSKRFSTRLIDSEQYAHGDSVQRSSGSVDASAATTNKLRTNKDYLFPRDRCNVGGNPSDRATV
jgi:hypothetical protein